MTHLDDRVLAAIAAKEGVCRVCGCTEENGCFHQGRGYVEVCCWSDQTRTMCSHCARRGGPPAGYPGTPAEWDGAVAAAQLYFREERWKRSERDPFAALCDDAFDRWYFHDQVLKRAEALGMGGEEGARANGRTDEADS
jgi:hypothetical protein